MFSRGSLGLVGGFLALKTPLKWMDHFVDLLQTSNLPQNLSTFLARPSIGFGSLRTSNQVNLQQTRHSF